MATQYLTLVLGQWLDYQTDWYGFGSTDPLAAAQGWDAEAFSYRHKGLP